MVDPSDARREALLKQLALASKLLREEKAAVAYRESLLALLSDAEDLLTRQPNDTSPIRKIAFGLFRLVTDSLELERGPIGKSLMALSGKLREYVAAVDNKQQ